MPSVHRIKKLLMHLPYAYIDGINKGGKPILYRNGEIKEEVQPIANLVNPATKKTIYLLFFPVDFLFISVCRFKWSGFLLVQCLFQ